MLAREQARGKLGRGGVCVTSGVKLNQFSNTGAIILGQKGLESSQGFCPTR